MEEAIIDTTRRVFIKEGIQRFTMDDLAAATGISKKTLYRFYPSRQDLVEKVCEWVAAEYENKMAPWDELTANSIDKLLGFISNVISFCKTVSPVFFNDLRRHYPLQWIELQNHLQGALSARLQSLLEKGISEGVFRSSLHPALVISIWQHHVQSDFEQAAALVNDYSKDEIFRQSVYLFLYGIISPAAVQQLDEKLRDIDWRTVQPILFTNNPL
ncbi:MAG: TetR/AcrR family transcriptional regulator [Flavihumibacter sp.]